MGNVMQVTNMMEQSNNTLDDNIDNEHDQSSKNEEHISNSRDNSIYTPGKKLTTDQEKLEYWMGFTSSW